MITLSRKAQDFLYSNGSQGIINYNGINYYFKKDKCMENAFLELVVEQMAKLVGIKCAHYERTEVYGAYYYYLSEDLNTLGEFKLACEVLGNNQENNSLYGIWANIEALYPQNTPFIMQEIIKIYFFDLLMMNWDRKLTNWGFIFLDENSFYPVIFDNDYSFNLNMGSRLTSKNACSDKLNSHLPIHNRYFMSYFENGILKKNLEDLEYFLVTSSSEFNEMVKGIYEMLTPKALKGIFTDLERSEQIEIPSKDNYLDMYARNYKAIGDIILARSKK